MRLELMEGKMTIDERFVIGEVWRELNTAFWKMKRWIR